MESFITLNRQGSSMFLSKGLVQSLGLKDVSMYGIKVMTYCGANYLKIEMLGDSDTSKVYIDSKYRYRLHHQELKEALSNLVKHRKFETVRLNVCQYPERIGEHCLHRVYFDIPKAERELMEKEVTEEMMSKETGIDKQKGIGYLKQLENKLAEYHKNDFEGRIKTKEIISIENKIEKLKNIDKVPI